jgi:hypothetical protein
MKCLLNSPFTVLPTLFNIYGRFYKEFTSAKKFCKAFWLVNITFFRPQTIHCKKRLAVFPSREGMSLTKLSLAGNNLSDIPAKDGKTANLFYSVLK